MAAKGCAVVVGGTSGIGRQLAKALAARGEEVILTGRDQARAQGVASEIGGKTSGIAMDLARPEGISGKLASVGSRLIEGTARKMIGQTFDCIRAKVEA